MKATILVVDDEPLNLDLMRRILSGAYKLVYARSGADALAAVAKHQPALVLLDIDMPDTDGYTVCQTIKDDPASEHIPVIFVTSHADVADEMRGFAVGAVDFIAKPISPPIVSARVRTHLSLVRASRLQQSYREAIGMLGEAGHFNDTDTGLHIWRMAAYSRALASAVGWDAERCETLELAAPMHDTGKIGIPDSILRKPAALTAEEWDVMKTHPRIGHDILVRCKAPVFQLAAEVALHHHEKWDGSGYPAGLAGTAIPESARIVALADVFDALSMKRPYKEAWSFDRIVSSLRDKSGSHFEPRLVDAFFSIMPEILDLQHRWQIQESLSEPGMPPFA